MSQYDVDSYQCSSNQIGVDNVTGSDKKFSHCKYFMMPLSRSLSNRQNLWPEAPFYESVCELYDSYPSQEDKENKHSITNGDVINENRDTPDRIVVDENVKIVQNIFTHEDKNKTLSGFYFNISSDSVNSTNNSVVTNETPKIDSSETTASTKTADYKENDEIKRLFPRRYFIINNFEENEKKHPFGSVFDHKKDPTRRDNTYNSKTNMYTSHAGCSRSRDENRNPTICRKEENKSFINNRKMGADKTEICSENIHSIRLAPCRPPSQDLLTKLGFTEFGSSEDSSNPLLQGNEPGYSTSCLCVKNSDVQSKNVTHRKNTEDEFDPKLSEIMSLCSIEKKFLERRRYLVPKDHRFDNNGDVGCHRIFQKNNCISQPRQTEEVHSGHCKCKTCSSLPNLSSHNSSSKSRSEKNEKLPGTTELPRKNPNLVDNNQANPPKKKKRCCNICKRKRRKKNKLSFDEKGNQTEIPNTALSKPPEPHPRGDICKCHSLPKLQASHQLVCRCSSAKSEQILAEKKKEQVQKGEKPKSVISTGCVTEKIVQLTRIPDGERNITIQIMPNCNHMATNAEQRHVESHKRPTENHYTTIVCPENCSREHHRNLDVNETNHYEIRTIPPSDTPDVQDTCSRTRAIPFRYREYNDYDKKHQWWNCARSNRKRKYTRSRKRERQHRQEYPEMSHQTFDEYYHRVKHSPNNYPVIPIQDCQRVLPIQNTHDNRPANVLKSIQRFNKRFLRDFFATPCPSSSKTGSPYCQTKIEEINPYYALKPATVNQSVQYETDCNKMKKTNTADDKNYNNAEILCDCLKYLTKKFVQDEGDFNNAMEYCCCCSFNHYCACQRRLKCCCKSTVKVPPKKIEEPKPIPCCTRCRSVEAKQPVKHCGTVVSTRNLKKAQTCQTNTEPRPKTPKVELPKKPLRCCRPKCCRCCNNCMPCCCCNTPCCFNGPKMVECQFQQNLPCYNCHCLQNLSYNFEHGHHTPQRGTSSVQFENNFDKLDVNTLKSHRSNIIETEKSTSRSQIDKSCQFSAEKFIVKTTNVIPLSNGIFEGTSDLVTRNLYDSGDKAFTKFGAPSRYYPWCENTFFASMPEKVYRFIGVDGNKKQLIDDVEVPTHSKQNISRFYSLKKLKQPSTPTDDTGTNTAKSKTLDAAGDLSTNKPTNHGNLSAIIESIFPQEESSKYDRFQSDIKTDFNYKRQKFASDTKFSNPKNSNISIGKSERSKSDTQPRNHNVEIYSRDNCSDGKYETKNIEGFWKMNSSISKKVRHKEEMNIKAGKDINNIHPTPHFIYTPKPFITKTGLAYFPSDNYKKLVKEQGSKLRTEYSNNRKIQGIVQKDSTLKLKNETVFARYAKPQHKITKKLEYKHVNPPNPKSDEENESRTKKTEQELQILNYENDINLNTKELEQKQSNFEKATAMALKRKYETRDNNNLSSSSDNEEHSLDYNPYKVRQEINIAYNTSFFTGDLMKNSPVRSTNTYVSNIVRSLEHKNKLSSRPMLESILRSRENVPNCGSSFDLKDFKLNSDLTAEKNMLFHPNYDTKCISQEENYQQLLEKDVD